MYADEITGAMKYTIEETERRRKIQQDYNRKNNITPRTIISPVKNSMQEHLQASGYPADDYNNMLQAAEEIPEYHSLNDLEKEIDRLEKEMHEAAGELAFERAADLRDHIKTLRMLEIELG